MMLRPAASGRSVSDGLSIIKGARGRGARGEEVGWDKRNAVPPRLFRMAPIIKGRGGLGGRGDE